MVDSSIIWDALVVGAGPAGSAAAAMLAERGRRVLLVEKAAWPREKACGGCVNANAVAALRRMNLHSAIQSAAFTDVARFSCGETVLQVDSPGRAISRAEMDQRLVQAAVDRGVCFISGLSARLLPEDHGDYRTVLLRGKDGSTSISARLVLAADGINGTLLHDEPWARWRIARGAWLGVAGTLPPSALSLSDRTIHMNIGAGGYVGLVRQADGRVHLGAALDPDRCRDLGGPGQLIRSIFADHRIELPLEQPLHGTGLLTRHRPTLGATRVLCLGDACGYVEPFTGEGIAWALASAEAAVALLPDDPKSWPADLPARWKKTHRNTVGRRQRICRTMRFCVHRPALWRGVARIINARPAMIDWFTPTPAGDVHD